MARPSRVVLGAVAVVHDRLHVSGVVRFRVPVHRDEPNAADKQVRQVRHEKGAHEDAPEAFRRGHHRDGQGATDNRHG